MLSRSSISSQELVAHEHTVSCPALADLLAVDGCAWQAGLGEKGRAGWQLQHPACSTGRSERSCQGRGSSAANQPCSHPPASCCSRIAKEDPGRAEQLYWMFAAVSSVIARSSHVSFCLDVLGCKLEGTDVFLSPYALMATICHTSVFVLLAYSAEIPCKVQMNILIEKKNLLYYV